MWPASVSDVGRVEQVGADAVSEFWYISLISDSIKVPHK